MKNFAPAFLLFLTVAATAQPTITSVSPLIDSPGTAVTITGTDFSATPANNIVYFGATRATVTGGNDTSLNVTVPTGATYAFVSVNNDTGFTAYSQYPFLPDYNNTPYAPGIIDFDRPALFTPNYPDGMAIADLDGDGKTDMVTADYSTNTIAVYRNISTSGSMTSGSFAAPVIFAVGNTPGAIAIGDIDGDGKPDVVVTNINDGTISVLLNTSSAGSISFAPQVIISAGYYPGQIAMGDIDGDGRPDMAIINNDGYGTMYVFQNTSSIGSVSFAAPVIFSGIEANGITIADVDGDGKPDIDIVSGYGDAAVYLNTSVPGVINAGSFAAPVFFAAGNTGQYSSIAVGDIDGDGKPDMTVANSSDNTISVFLNTSSIGAVSFAPQLVFPTGNTPQSIAIGDMDGDGKADLVVGNLLDYTASTFRNTSSVGAISFSTETIAASYQFYVGGVAIADMDGDGKPDLVLQGTGPHYAGVEVLRNDPVLLPAPKITAVSPAIDSPGTSVTITGTNFNTTAANDIVYFGATQATVNSASATSLSVTVPLGATDMPVTVDNAANHLMAFSPAPFLPTYNNSAYLPGVANFDPQVAFGAGSSPTYVTIGDLDGDGKPDMVVTDQGDNTVSIYLNTSTGGSVTSGSFAAPLIIPTATQAQSAVIADLDGDGRPDIAIVGSSAGVISILRNTSTIGSLSFDTVSIIPADANYYLVGAGSSGIAVGDIDGDGKPDLALANLGNATLVLLRNTSVVGAISFEDGVDFPTNFTFGAYALTIADIDGDGKPDVVAANAFYANQVTVWRNKSSVGFLDTGSLATPVNFATGNSPYMLVVGDIDGDGKPDVATSNLGDNTISVLRNTSTPGTVSFATQVTFATGNGPNAVAMGDINGDGKPDLAFVNGFDNAVGVLLNTSSAGAISFAPQVAFASGGETFELAVADIDGDGKADIAVTSNNSSTVSILRNDPLSAIMGANTICTGGSVTLSDLAQFGTWSSSNTAVATVDGVAGIVNGVAIGVDTISYAVAGGSAMITVTVGLSATAGTITGATSVNTGSNITLTDAVSGGTWSASNGNATVSAGLVTGVTTGLDTISYTVSGSCGTAVATQVVTVNSIIIPPPPSCTTAPDILTFAGDHVNGYSGDGGYATAAEMGSPYGVAADAVGNVYIADYYNNAVRMVAPTGIITTVAGTGVAGYNGDNIAATSAQLNGPQGVALDAAGNLYIADRSNERVRMVNTSGVITTIAGNGFHGGYDGHSYGNGGPADSASLDYPVAVAVDCSGNIYIADQGSQTVRKINTSGIITQFAGNFAGGYNGDDIAATSAQLNYPSGVAADCAGNVYIADAWNNRVRMVNASGIITTVAGNGTAGYSGDGSPGGSAELWLPTGVTLDACGDLYICDWQNNVVRFLGADGYISTFAGDNAGDYHGYDGDGGPATAAYLYLPAALAIDGLGNVYIADYGNYVIRAMGNALPPERRFYNGTTQNMTVCENQAAISIDSQMAVPNTANGITETWSVSISPLHGTLSGFNATTTSNEGVTSPSGVTYTPAAGYAGQDAFTIVMSDGTTAASTTMNVHIDSLPNSGMITGVMDIASGRSTNLADATGAQNGVWSSSNTEIATVNATGGVMATGSGAVTIFYTVTNSCGSNAAGARITVTDASAQSSNLTLLPNPNNGTFTIKGALGTLADENVTLEVQDMLGQVIYKNEVVAHSGNLNETITLSNTLANGMYMLNLHSKTGNKVFHFVLEQ